MATISDVAKAASVSTSTVSHVINETRFVRPETRERVLSVMREMSYKPNRLASSLRKSQTQTIGVLVPNAANPFFAEILAGIESACFEHGYNFIMGNADDDPERELAYLQVLLERQVDGVLLVAAGTHEKSLELLALHGTPAVTFDRSANSLQVDEILADSKQGGLLATNYLLDLGHRRIACIKKGSDLTSSTDRVLGYQEALLARGVAIDDDLIVAGDYMPAGGYNACVQLLDLDEPPSAIFTCNDLMAVGALSAIYDRGLRVPDDISVIGYDNISLASYTIPPLTTIAQPIFELGKLAVDKLVARLKDSDAERNYPSREVLPVSIFERESCRPFNDSQ